MNRETIIQILTRNNIPFVTQGKNVGKNVIGINCPFCGNDTGYHLGILPNGYYSCWKDASHRGKVEYLLTQLLNISYNEAKELLKGKILLDDDWDLWYNIKTKKEEPLKEIQFPKEFREIKNSGMEKMFYNYLSKRGFEVTQEFLSKYKLKCSLIGDFSYRIILPIIEDGKLITWTGRSIDPNAVLRYKDLASNQSVKKAKHCIYNYDNIKYGGRKLYILEGPFDVLKLDWYSPKDISATCIFTTSMTDEQVSMLIKASEKFKEVFITLDRGADHQALKLLDQLSFLNNIDIKKLPDDIKDAGEMNRKQVEEFI